MGSAANAQIVPHEDIGVGERLGKCFGKEKGNAIVNGKKVSRGANRGIVVGKMEEGERESAKERMGLQCIGREGAGEKRETSIAEVGACSRWGTDEGEVKWFRASLSGIQESSDVCANPVKVCHPKVKA